MKLAPTLQLTGLQRRVLKAIDDNWADLTTVGRRCGWGGEGCRRTQCGLWLVACALARHGDGAAGGRCEVRDRKYLHVVDEPKNIDAGVSPIEERDLSLGYLVWVCCDLPMGDGRWGENFQCRVARNAERAWLWAIAYASRMVREGAYVRPGKFVGERSMA